MYDLVYLLQEISYISSSNIPIQVKLVKIPHIKAKVSQALGLKLKSPTPTLIDSSNN